MSCPTCYGTGFVRGWGGPCPERHQAAPAKEPPVAAEASERRSSPWSEHQVGGATLRCSFLEHDGQLIARLRVRERALNVSLGLTSPQRVLESAVRQLLAPLGAPKRDEVLQGWLNNLENERVRCAVEATKEQLKGWLLQQGLTAAPAAAPPREQEATSGWDARVSRGVRLEFSFSRTPTTTKVRTRMGGVRHDLALLNREVDHCAPRIYDVVRGLCYRTASDANAQWLATQAHDALLRWVKVLGEQSWCERFFKDGAQ
jgi:hypothetical protein